MDRLLSSIQIQVNPHTYLKNPESSDLGRRIISGSIDLIEEKGFEDFTFRKLAQYIQSTEASVYRYFESKYKLLLYLSCWYWVWSEYRLVFGLANIPSPVERLEKAIVLLTQQIEEDSSFTHINEEKLNRIVIVDSSKAYLNQMVDQENQEGVFSAYKQLVRLVSEIILEINPNYKYPQMLVSTLIEGAHHQRFFAEHLPRLTNVHQGEDSITEFYKEMVFKAITTPQAFQKTNLINQ
jgi:AcrR family transcriptional regulator